MLRVIYCSQCYDHFLTNSGDLAVLVYREIAEQFAIVSLPYSYDDSPGRQSMKTIIKYLEDKRLILTTDCVINGNQFMAKAIPKGYICCGDDHVFCLTGGAHE